MRVATATQPVQNQRLREPDLRVFISRANGVPFEEGLQRADHANFVIASNARLSKALVGSEEWKLIRAVFACWSGTYTAYVEPNTTFGEKAEVITDLEGVVGSRYFIVDGSCPGKRRLFPVPEEYLGIANAILVAEHPDYRVHEDGNNLITVPAGMALKQAVDIVKRFPAYDAWYLPDTTHGIPQGNEVSYSLEARHLWRISKRVGPVRRGYDYFDYDGRQCVFLNDQPSYGCGMAVEATEGGAPRAVADPTKINLIRNAPDELVVRGPKERVDAIVRLIEQNQ